MKRLTFLFLVALATSIWAKPNPKPNIVFIITDDQSWDSLGFMGGKVHTPRLNQMAKDGIYFTDFNVTSTVCSPSRYSFLTGRYAGRCKGKHFMEEHPPGDQTQVENIGEIEPDKWNLPKILQKNGYRTGFVGKSHVIRHDWLVKKKNYASVMETYPVDVDPSQDPEVNAKMQRNHQRWCDEMKKYGFDFADGVYGANLKELQNQHLNVHNLDWTIDKAFNFIDEESDKPFFLYFSTTLHHGPAPWNNKFTLHADPRMTGEGFVKEGFDVLPSRQDVLKRNKEAGFKPKDAFALWLDDGVGALIDKIKEKNLSKDTLIIFVPDHGSFNHAKATLYDYGMRVPMLMQWDGVIKPDTKYPELAANIDLAPTLLELCHITPPENYHTDGLSFKNVLFGDSKPYRASVFGELGHSRAIKTKNWKYVAIRYPDDVQKRIDSGQKFRGFDGSSIPLPYLTRNGHLGFHASNDNPLYFEKNQLFNLKADSTEQSNVYGDYPEVEKELKESLSKKLKSFPGRPFGEFTEY